MARIRVLLDACVLLPYQLSDLILRLAESELFEPLWSEEILDEVERNLVAKFDVRPEKANRRVARMRAAFPNAAVKHYESISPAMATDPKDRHVAAAAVRGGAAVLVTANLRDFPPEALLPYDIEVVHPDAFLQDQLDLAPNVTIGCIAQQRAAYTRPQFTFTDFYLALRVTVPTFAEMAAQAERASQPPLEQLPLELVSHEAAQDAFFPDGEPDPLTPMGAAFAWWTALKNRTEHEDTLRLLTHHPAAWGDYTWAEQKLSGAAIMQYVVRCPEDAEIAYVKFMPDIDQPMRAFQEFPLTQALVLTMVRYPDGYWRAWGLSENSFPSATDVRGDHAG